MRVSGGGGEGARPLLREHDVDLCVALLLLLGRAPADQQPLERPTAHAVAVGWWLQVRRAWWGGALLARGGALLARVGALLARGVVCAYGQPSD